jgi:predicted Zn-ribbon and HTH transcriptional regulator
MKKNNMPNPKEELPETLNKRRKDYASSRDLQASENNEAIAKRLVIKGRNPVKCTVCGKEFDAGITPEETPVCPDCK